MHQAAQNDRPGTHPLLGMRVVSLENALAAPICTPHLADLGAQAIMIERPGAGDFPQGFGAFVHGESTCFRWLNRGQPCLALHVKANGAPATQDGTVVFSIQQAREWRTFCEPAMAQPELGLHEDDRTTRYRIASAFGDAPTVICAHP